MAMNRFFDYPTNETPLYANELVLLPGWSAREWSRLLAYTQTYRFVAGETLMRQGDTERALYLVLAGVFEVLVPQGASMRRRASIETGSVIGEQAFFDTRPRSATIKAASSGEVARLDFDTFEIFAAREPRLAYAVLLDLGRIVSLRLRQQTAPFATTNEVSG
jgi:CRP-like cAMP-binding protein